MCKNQKYVFPVVQPSISVQQSSPVFVPSHLHSAKEMLDLTNVVKQKRAKQISSGYDVTYWQMQLKCWPEIFMQIMKTKSFLEQSSQSVVYWSLHMRFVWYQVSRLTLLKKGFISWSGIVHCENKPGMQSDLKHQFWNHFIHRKELLYQIGIVLEVVLSYDWI